MQTRSWDRTLDSAVSRLAVRIRENGPARFPDLPGASEALVAWSLGEAFGEPVLWVCDGPRTLAVAHRDALTVRGPDRAESLLYYPSWESFPAADSAYGGIDPDIVGSRLRVLRRLMSDRDAAGNPPLVITCIQALLEGAPSPETLAGATIKLELGFEGDPEEIVSHLQRSGHEPASEVVEKGHVALRGGLLDVWPVSEEWPLRIEFAAETIESIRAFDPSDQRSVSRLDHADLVPADEWPLVSGPRGRIGALLDYLPATSVLLWSDPDSVSDYAAIHEQSAVESGATQKTMTYQALRRRIARRSGAMQVSTGGVTGGDCVPGGFAPVPVTSRVRAELLEPDLLEQERRQRLDDLYAAARDGRDVIVFMETSGSLEHFREQMPPRVPRRCVATTGILSGGFVSDELGLVVVSEADLYGKREEPGRRYDPRSGAGRSRRRAGERVSEASEIEPGDLVVHVDHGLGRYRGLSEIRVNDAVQEVFTIEYAEGARLHVPVSQAHLLTRYAGLSRSSPRLHRLGGARWKREKVAAEEAVADLASALLETQARRCLLNGHAFKSDTPWQREFEASFPYRETDDQSSVIRTVKDDMQSPQPMDRLVCGDAGYGKTEVAMRAAFKAVMDGKQVAVLVPTTVLAQQHFDTFAGRMAAYPFRVEMLSRFCSQGRRRDIVHGMSEGAVDIVVGTHALVQPGVAFRDLGLVIIDEEQRFGVVHKERLKELRQLVDVLTLTATPIPRTLYMSMTGARDMSLLQSPPRERVPVETIVARSDAAVIRKAILRELNREGQVFYLHNRVMTIERINAGLAELVPEARVRVAHGQMRPRELASVMHAFVQGEFDVLLCTTIIESGMDIPRANTILIDRADRFGIADLYQLRGRVGRSNRKAYAYLLLPPGRIDSDARRRIGAVSKHSDLGAGFKLALRDLEIRGAGNLLGAAQSGHISAIGFGLYCQLLRRTVARRKGEKVPGLVDVGVVLDFIELAPRAAAPERAAVLPYEYIDDERLRVGVYRRLAQAASCEEVDSLTDELRDRFGPLPDCVGRLLQAARLRVLAAGKRIVKIESRDDKVMLLRKDGYAMRNGRYPRLQTDTADRKLAELAEWIRTVDDWCTP